MDTRYACSLIRAVVAARCGTPSRRSSSCTPAGQLPARPTSSTGRSRTTAQAEHRSDVAASGPLEGWDSVLSAQVSSRCLVDDWHHVRSRRAGPLHRWLMDDAVAAELPAWSSIPAGRNACRAPAVRHVSRWTYHLDVPGMRRRGVRTTADCRLPDSGRCRSGALSLPALRVSAASTQPVRSRVSGSRRRPTEPTL